ncbi:MAG: cytochrome c [Chromatiaceae bacterium]|jgi:cytochrome c553|nr:cytochrome c [Chromatiaceae bacterium]
MSHPWLLAITLLSLVPAAAASPTPGQPLYEAHCLGCHGPEVYTREDRKVTSLPGLQRQVQRCELALGLKWFDDEIGAVADYLNESYYRFEP